MFSLDDHGSALGIEHLDNWAYDVVGDSLLNLEAPRRGIDYSGNGANSDCMTARHVGDMSLADNGQEVPFAEGYQSN
jgi:hypothetical protein